MGSLSGHAETIVINRLVTQLTGKPVLFAVFQQNDAMRSYTVRACYFHFTNLEISLSGFGLVFLSAI